MLGPKQCRDKKNLKSKISSRPKKCGSKKLLVQMNFQNNFGSKNLGRKNFGSIKMLGQKFWGQKTFELKKNESKKIGSKNILGPKEFSVQKI